MGQVLHRIPPGVVHSCYLQHAVQYRSVDMAPQRCRQLPQTPDCRRIGPTIKAILRVACRRP